MVNTNTVMGFSHAYSSYKAGPPTIRLGRTNYIHETRILAAMYEHVSTTEAMGICSTTAFSKCIINATTDTGNKHRFSVINTSCTIGMTAGHSAWWPTLEKGAGQT